ncbi:hypothetical protein ACFOWZ_01340 [Lentzea rhizosphaerae]|uniref:DNA binding domain-containing protein, excisionase family n=1 Tax=Lentzea rhizosphaerae TaxID=2041025 RepID=A0ABV8BI66_9PSEU
MTVQQAADLLNVSRAYVIDLLEAGTIRRGEDSEVEATSLIEYKRLDDRLRRAAADELSASTRGWS